MQEACTTMALAWNRTLGNYQHGVQDLIQIIQHAQFKEADPGFMGKIWEHAKGLIEKAATFVSGTPLAAKIGFDVIDKVLTYQNEMEAARRAEDEASFLQKLRDSVTALQVQGDARGGGMLNEDVHKLDLEFVEKGKENEDKLDTWKKGDQVVFGAQADFLKDLKARAKDYSANVPTSATFLNGFLQEWVKANHKERHKGAWRSPFESSTYMDGYVALDLELRYSSRGFFFNYPSEATLHCPKSDDVAKHLMSTMSSFSLNRLSLPMRISIEATDEARAKMYRTWARDRTNTIRLNSYGDVEGVVAARVLAVGAEGDGPDDERHPGQRAHAERLTAKNKEENGRGTGTELLFYSFRRRKVEREGDGPDKLTFFRQLLEQVGRWGTVYAN